VVDLSNHSYTCYFWDPVGIPCRHVVATINYKVENPEAYVHAYYKRAAYEACYSPKITPINGQLWLKEISRNYVHQFIKHRLGDLKS